jgi:hypothetical protein
VLEQIQATESDMLCLCSRCSAPIEVSVGTSFQTTLCIEDGPIYEYEPLPASRISVILHFHQPYADKAFEIQSDKSGALFGLLRNHPERIEQWCTENQVYRI